MDNGSGETEQELINKLSEFDLNEEEEQPAILYEDDINEGLLECATSCFGRVFAPKEILMKYLRLSMMKAWKCDSLKVVKINTNTYHIFLRTKEETDRVVTQGPWCLDNSLISIVKWERGIVPKSEDFHLVKFWL